MPPRRRSTKSASASRSRANSGHADDMDVDLPDLPARSGSRHEWGRILICGGMDWERNANPPSSKEAGAKGVKLSDDDHAVPVKPRWMSHLKITKVIGGPQANYTIVIDLAGTAHVFGRIPFFGMENPTPRNRWHVVSCDDPLHVPGPNGGKWEGGAVGEAHFLLFSGNQVYGAGDNRASPLGIAGELHADLVRIPGPWERNRTIREVATGQTFSLFLDSAGDVYAAGKSEFGQLGNGTTGELVLRGGKQGFTYQVPPKRMKEIANKRIVSIASGNYHALALDTDGAVYSWGNNQYGALGLGDAGHQLVPTRVELEHPVTAVYAGPASSFVVTDNDGPEVWVAGKCRLVGPGSSSTPYRTFEKLELANVQEFSTGFISHFATVLGDDDIPRTYAWGQGATHGELGIGSDFLSASEPTSIEHLENIEVLCVAAGLVHTVFLVKPDETLEERIGNAAQSDSESEEEPAQLPRGRPPRRGRGRGRGGRGRGGHAVTLREHEGREKGKGKEKEQDGEKEKKLAIERWPPVDSGDLCLTCGEGERDDLTFLECERCEEGYHMDCLRPPLWELPEGEWFCPRCEQSGFEWSHPPPDVPDEEVMEDDGPGRH